ncbi:MAG: LysR family transcriptional regulator [Dehalococcoidia bacterium]|nr:LysR family transcriptional regulator [Dehalococcoidia bacterium]
MNLDYLKTYREVIRLGSFSEVAKRLSISQPAVSFQIQALERDLGIRLIDRRQKSITMTQAGKRLLHFAELVEKERDRLVYDLSQLRDEVTGDLAISASTIPGEFLLPPILAEFKRLHPAIAARMMISDSLAVISRIQNNEYEIGFCGALPEGTDLTAFKIAEDEIVLIVFPEHPFAERQKVSFGELQKESLILREETSGTQRSLESLLLKAGFDLGRCTPSLVLGSTQAVISAVEAGIGIAFVSNLAINKSLTLRLVKVVGIEGLRLRRNFYCIYRKERIVSRLLEEFIAFVESRIPQT